MTASAFQCPHLPEGTCDGCLENPRPGEVFITTSDANLLIQALYIWRSPQEDRLHDDRVTGFERKLVEESLAHVDAVIAKVQALEVKDSGEFSSKVTP